MRRIGLALAAAAVVAASLAPVLTRSSEALPQGAAGVAMWRNGDNNRPAYAPWSAGTFGGAVDSADMGKLRIMQGAASSTRDEAIVIGVRDDGGIAGQIWSGGTWSQVPFHRADTVTETFWWGFDVAYESQSGDALVVWNNGSAVSYSVWNGVDWDPVNTVSAPVSGEPQQMQLAADPNSDEMVLVVSTSASHDYAVVWDGSSWGNGVDLSGGGWGDLTDVNVAYEQQSGDALVVYGTNSASPNYMIWSGSAWLGPGTVAPPGGIADAVRWTAIAADPTSDRIAIGVSTFGSDAIWLAVWTGSTWSAQEVAAPSSPVDVFPGVAVAFESASGDLLATWAAGVSAIRYKTWNGAWSAEGAGPDVGNPPNSMVLDSQAGTDQIMLTVQDSNSELSAALWGGGGFGTPTQLGSDTKEVKNQPFVFLWDRSPNDAPLFDQDLMDRLDQEGAAVALAASATDPDGDPLTYSASGLPHGLAIDPATGVITGTIPHGVGFGSSWSVTIRVEDSTGFSDSDSFSWTVSPATGLLLSTRDNVTGSGAPGLTDWLQSDVLSFGGPTFDLEPTGTTGTFSILGSLSASGFNDVQALHLVTRTVTIGSGPSVTVQAGDLLFVNNGGVTLPSGTTIDKNDVLRFRPSAPGDYSSGTVELVLDNPMGNEIRGLSLVEEDTAVGEATLTAGSFLVTRSGGAEEQDVWLFVPLTAGPGTTSGTSAVLLDEDETGVDSKLWGVHLVVEDLGGVLTAGSVLLSMENGDAVGPDGLSVAKREIFKFDVTRTSLGVDPAIVGAALVFQGADVGLSDDKERIDAITIRPGNRGPVFDQDHGDRIAAEGDTVSLPAPATDLDGDPLTYSATGLPPGVSIDPSTGLLFGTIDFSAATGSPHAVTLRVTDPGGLFDSDTFAWTVTDTGQVPAFDQDLGDRADAEGAAVSIDAGATDPDGDSLTYSATGLPPGIGIDGGTGRVTGVIGYTAAAGSPYAVQVRVEDPGGLFDTDTFSWTITDVSVPLGVAKTSDGGGRVDPGQVIEYTITVTNPGVVTQTGITITDDTPPGTVYSVGSTVLELPAVARDRFDAVAYDGSNGALPWAGPWTEHDGGLPTEGEDQIATSIDCVAGPCLRLGNGDTAMDFTGSSIWRDVDLSGRSTATLEFMAKRVIGGSVGGDILVQARGNGLGWTTLQTITVDASDPAPVPYSLDIGAFIGPDTGIRFAMVGTWRNSYLHIDDLAVVADGTVTRAGGSPPAMASGLELDPGETLWVRFRVTVDNPVAFDQIVNQVTVTSDAGPPAYLATVTDAVERPPAFSQDLGDRTDSETTVVSLSSPATDPNGDALVYSAIGLPAGLSIDPTTGLVSGTIAYTADAGSPHAVTLRAADPAGNQAVDTFTWTVVNVNRGPDVDHPGDQTDAEGVAVSLLVAATDPDGDDFTWSATGLPPGLSIDAGSGLISGTVGFGAAAGSPYSSVIRAIDDGLPSAEGAALVTWNVTDTNRPPNVTNPGDRANSEGSPVAFAVNGSDPDGDAVTWSAVGLPPGLSLDPDTGVISGTITYTAAGLYPVTVTATDDGVPVLSTDAVFVWAVTNVNRAPALSNPGNRSSAEGDILSLPVVGSDPDGDAVTWSAVGLPPGLSIDPDTGVISGTITYTAAGLYPVTVTATDDGVPVLSTDAVFVWAVTDTNRAPALSNPGDQTTAEGEESLTLPIIGSDPDGDVLTWSAADLPPGLSIDGITGEITGSVDYAGDIGSPYTVTVTATDGGTPVASSNVMFLWTVVDTNRAPDVVNPGSRIDSAGQMVSLPMVGSDPDGDGIDWSAAGLPPGLSIDATTGEITGTLDPAGVGVHVVSVTATDDDLVPAVATVMFKWAVADDLVIVKTSDAGGTAEPGQTITYTIIVDNGTAGPHTGVLVDDPLPPGTSWLSTRVTYPDYLVKGTFADEFDTWDYAGNEGTLPWAGSWAETGDDGDPNSGAVHLHSHDGLVLLEMEDDADALTRTADLSGASMVYLSYGFRRHKADSDDVVYVEVSTDGVEWTEVSRHSGPGTDSLWQTSPEFDISAHISPNTRVRFRTGPSFNGEFRVDWVELVMVARGSVVVAGGPPPALNAAVELFPGEGMTVELVVAVDDPLSTLITSIENTATVTSDQQIAAHSDSTSDAVNHPPVFDQDRVDRSDAEGTAISVPNPASDPNNDVLTWTATGLPPGLSIDPDTGVIVGTIGFDAASGSPYGVEVRVDDPGGKFDVDTFAWAVTDTNRPPLVVAPGDRSDAEADVVSQSVFGSDPDGDTLTWEATGLPDGLSIDPATGVISGTISFDAAPGSPYAVTVTVTDDRLPNLQGSASLAWAVTDTNRAPVVTSPGDQSDAEGDVVSLALSASDPDGDSLTWEATGLPSGLSIDPDTGVIAGTIGYGASAGSPYAVTVTVTDDRLPNLQGSASLAWAVTDTNRAPVVTSPGDQSDAEGDVVSLALSASDPDGDSLTWEATGLPSGLSIDPDTGVIAGTIGYGASAGSPYAVTVTVTDDRLPNLQGSASLAWTVTDTNRAPVVTSPGDQVSDESDVVSQSVFGSDPDGDSLTWEAMGLPPGLSIDPVSGRITGTINYEAAAQSPHTVILTVTDDGVPRLDDSVTFTWTVTDTNRAPVVTSPGDQSDAEGDVVSLALTASDPDDDRLIWGAAGLPAGIAIDPATGIVSGAPSYDAAAASPYRVTVTATDDGVPRLDDSVTFTWTVADTNRAPVVTRPADRTDRLDQVVRLALVGSDPDGDAITWSATGLPLGISLNAVSGVIEGTTALVGTFTVTVTATDGGTPNRATSATFTWRVLAPGVPVVAAIPDQFSTVGDTAGLQATATHPDGLEFTWSATGLPTGAAIDPESGAATGVLIEVGVFEVVISATDTRGGVGSAGFTWTVSPEPNRPPTAVDDAAAVTVTDGDDDVGAVRVEVLGNDSDPDGDPLTVVTVTDPEAGDIRIEDGVVVFIPPQGWTGTVTVTYTIVDPTGDQASAEVTVTINPDLNALLEGPILDLEPEEIGSVDLASLLTAGVGTDLVFGTVLQSLHVLRMPLALLGAAVFWSLLLGGLLNLGVMMRGGIPSFVKRRKVPMAIIMAPHGGKVPAHAQPGAGEALWRFGATDTNITATGAHRSVDGEDWLQVETPEGRGWVEALHLTEQIDAVGFSDDSRPIRILEDLVERIRDRDDLTELISGQGLWVTHHDDPIHFEPDRVAGLLDDSAVRTWPGRNPAYPDVQGAFGEVVGAGILQAWDHPQPRLSVDRPTVPSTVIPVEYTNLHSISVGADLHGRDHLDQNAWMVFYSYERGHPRVIALHKEG